MYAYVRAINARNSERAIWCDVLCLPPTIQTILLLRNPHVLVAPLCPARPSAMWVLHAMLAQYSAIMPHYERWIPRIHCTHAYIYAKNARNWARVVWRDVLCIVPTIQTILLLRNPHIMVPVKFPAGSLGMLPLHAKLSQYNDITPHCGHLCHAFMRACNECSEFNPSDMTCCAFSPANHPNKTARRTPPSRHITRAQSCASIVYTCMHATNARISKRMMWRNEFCLLPTIRIKLLLGNPHYWLPPSYLLTPLPCCDCTISQYNDITPHCAR